MHAFSKLSTIVLNMENKDKPTLPIFKSKTRQSLLRLFMTNQSERYYVRQLQKMLGISVGTIHRELRNLENAGIIVSEAQANVKLYQVNTSYPLFEEMQKIVMKTIGVEGLLKAALAGLPGIEGAFIFGSFASGDQTARSDIDLFIIGSCDEKLLNEKLRMIERDLSREVNYVSMSIGEFAQAHRESAPFVKEILSGPIIVLIGDEHEFR